MGAIEKDRMLEFRGDDLHDRDGEKVGRIVEIYLDAESSQPEWALVHTGLFGGKRTFVPLAGATEVEGQVRVPVEKDTVKDAPQIEPNGKLTQTEETELFRHYGIERNEAAIAEDEGAIAPDDAANAQDHPRE